MTATLELPDGASLAYDDAGSGRPLVLIHGVSMSRRFFERNVPALAEHHRVINVDLRGHGESPASEGGHTVAQYARDIHHMLGALGLDGAVLVGWSMGTMVAWDPPDIISRRGIGRVEDRKLHGLTIDVQGIPDRDESRHASGGVVVRDAQVDTWGSRIR